jgi:ABC-type polysaccharide/polyol phosphate export permease
MRIESALFDLASGLREWRVWSMLAMSEIRGRYRRSTLGQFWITISMAVTIISLGFVYAIIFRVDVASYLPVMATSFICWGLIASLVNNSATVFTEAESYLRSSALPRSVFIYKYLLRDLLFFAHNLVLVPVLMVLFGIVPKFAILLFLPASVLTLANGVWLGILIGTFCARYRDMPQIVASVVQVAFFVSPVIWGRAQLGAEHSMLIDLNPFAILLELLREPLLGRIPPLNYWLSACAILIVGLMIALPFYARFRARISFYI